MQFTVSGPTRGFEQFALLADVREGGRSSKKKTSRSKDEVFSRFIKNATPNMASRNPWKRIFQLVHIAPIELARTFVPSILKLMMRRGWALLQTSPHLLVLVVVVVVVLVLVVVVVLVIASWSQKVRNSQLNS